MSFERIVGQERAKDQARAWLRAGRVPHAILISGPAGAGKRHLALELAKAVNCREGQPCGACASCRKIDSYLHPDILVLLPLPPPGSKTDSGQLREEIRTAVLEYVGEERSLSRSNVNIARDHIRLLQREMAYAPTEAEHRVGVILEAERMHPAGANSLLKLLEEPPRGAILILVSAAPERLLPTVLSRCQRLPLQLLGQAELKAHLRDRGVAADRLELAVRLGGGSVQRGLQVAEGQFDETRERVEEFLLAGIKGEDDAYWDLLEETGFRTDRGQLEAFLEVCALYLRDLLLLSLERETATVHLDRLEFLRELLPHFPAERIEAAAIEVDRAFSHLARNVNTNLVLAGLWRLLRAPGHPVRDLVAGKDLRDW